MPTNDSYERSLYMAAIQSGVHSIGLVSPVVHRQQGKDYEFDFYQPESKKFFKIFKGFDPALYDHYIGHSGKRFLIYDSRYLDCRMDVSAYTGNLVLFVEGGITTHIHGDPTVLIYHERELCIYKPQEDGRWLCIPAQFGILARVLRGNDESNGQS